jgi:hypothetical protein
MPDIEYYDGNSAAAAKKSVLVQSWSCVCSVNTKRNKHDNQEIMKRRKRRENKGK